VPSPTKVLYLAFDACDREVVRELSSAGELPTFAALLHRGAVVEVEPPPGVYISANWPSFSSGLAPDRHEYICWVDVDPETYEWHETSPPRAHGTPFWHEVAARGHRTCVFDVPHSMVRSDSAAVQVVEWGCHDRHLGTGSSPDGLIAELDAAVGPHPIGRMAEQRPLNFAPCDFAHRAGLHRTHPETVALWEDLLLAIDRKQAASLRLLDEGDWSLFGVVFGEAHCVGHQLWALHDPDHPRYDPTMVAQIGDPVREMYRRLDATLAAHLDRVDDDTTVYVHLSHGMGPHYDGTHLLDIILRRFHESETATRGWRTRALRSVMGRVPASAQARALGALAPRMRAHIDRHPPGPNEPWALPLAERPWFQVPNNAVGGIRLNLQGRESQGVVPAGRYDAVCRDLERWLYEIVNVDTGEPLVHRVRRSDERYRRRTDDRFPDLFVEWNSNAPIDRVYSPRIGLVVGHDDQWRTGDHRRHGLLLVSGPGIEPGHRRGTLGMHDVGVTLSAAVGVTLEDVDGRAAADLLPGATTTGHAGSGAEARDGRWRGAPRQRSALERLVTRMAAEQRSTRHLADHLDVRTQQLDHRANVVAAAVEAQDARLGDLEREAAVRTVTDWVRAAEVAESATVSVVVPTRDRSSVLPRAIESVLSQTYHRVELVVVDDGSTDDTADVLAKFDDARVRVLRTAGVGVCAARNLGLAAATGEYVVYLDDDNIMTPWWCKAVVWAFEQRRDVDVLYGARLIDDVTRARREHDGSLPSMQFEPYDFERLTEHNFADMNVLAHRAGLAEAHFDETISSYGDWDLFWRLTRHAPPLELPVLACHYSTQADHRLSVHPNDERDRNALRAKFTRLLAED
jgi:predicted AlkP superfamily phosphohydrolase/phosphomutase